MTDEQQEQQPQVVETTLFDLLEEANLAMQVMSRTNPHRRVIYKLGEALKAVSDRYIQKCDECDRLVRELEAHTTQTQEEATYEQSFIEQSEQPGVPTGIVITDQ